MKVVLVVLLATIVASQEIAPLLTVDEPIPGKYIVKLKEGRKIDDVVINLAGGKVTRKFSKVFSGFAADLSDELVEGLRKSDAVEFIEQDGVVRASAVASWGLDRIDQLALPLDDIYQSDFGDGSGVDVYVLDTGINLNHVDWQGRSSYGIDTVSGDFDSEDCDGHGSHCAGTIGGTQYGVAKAAHLIGVRVLDCTGSGSYAGIIEGCEWVISDKQSKQSENVVASMSLGGGGNALLDAAIEQMVDAGITVVVAAGNSDRDACSYSPARAEPAITVGATDINDVRASFSNFGYCLDIFAPGVAITSAWYGEPDASNTISGTSMACPHVAGAAATVLGAQPGLLPVEVKEVLQLKAIPDIVSDPEVGSPNLLLYVGEGSGGGFIPTPPPECITNFTSPTGIITSPNYPGSYPNSEKCSYLIMAANEEEIINLSFTEFSLEFHSTCFYDSLTVYDGNSPSDVVLDKLCGSTVPGDLTSTGPNMLLVFESDSSVRGGGFSAEYNILQMGGCGDIISSPVALLTSPNYPDNYGNHADCSFTIHAPVGQTITLSFDDIDIEEHVSCSSDAVEVHDGDMHGPYLEKVCGNTIPSPITSTKNSMYVRFISDESVNRRGFKAITKME
ncbi:extracellular serine proteinase-like [Lytechinus variegatus]|uniref:extracellular serine proteinase-like n=1 Tax=Lytechinus variegatus TaxID=7654 RepID=UPI001BB17C80|nr:extracellular serine proteinase-like [Lytechinus variegatus]